MTGRGAWSSVGGTLNYDGTGPGVYYRSGRKGALDAGTKATDANERAVHGAVVAYQQAVWRRTGIALADDGVFGPVTANAVKQFQELAGTKPDGVVGPTTSKNLLYPDLRKRVNVYRSNHPKTADLLTPLIVCGVITHESSWDAGAVGYVDDRDVGLAQINAEAHPEWSEEARLDPMLSFEFVTTYLDNALRYFDNDLDLAIASYNLGLGGATVWDDKGRPDLYTPKGSTTERDMGHYVENIKTVCVV
jgi:hypothetical protein